MPFISRIMAFFAIALFFSCGSGESNQAAHDTITEDEVKDFIGKYDVAWEQRDSLKLKELMDENYIYFTSVGSTIARPVILGWFRPEVNYRVDTAYRNEIEVRLSGNMAIVNSHWVGNGIFGTEKFDDDQRCGLVIQKINGSIKLIAEHCVQIRK